MVENIGRKVFWIVALLVLAVLSMVLPEHPFRLGLDLQGGTRYVCRIDFEQALAEGKITPQEYADKTTLLQNTVNTIRERVDPHGVLEATIRAEGTDRFVVEVPSTANLAEIDAALPLEDASLPAGQRALSLTAGPQDADTLRNFPTDGGVIAIGAERISYDRRQGNQLTGLERGYDNTTAAVHPQGSEVRLVSVDPIRKTIENPGALEFFIGTDPANDFPPGKDLASQRAKLDTWLAEHPNTPIAIFNATPEDQGGPWSGIRWFPHVLPDGAGPDTPLAERRLDALTVPPNEEGRRWRFTGEDLATVNRTSDDLGLPAVSLELEPARKGDFGEYTAAHVDRPMAIVINDEIVTMPVIEEALYGACRISGGQGGFTEQEVKQLVQVLRSGSLKLKPILQEEERVGASLGEKFVKQGAFSAILGVAIVLAFMSIYYRRLGVFSAISMLCNLVLLMGVMAFLQATLTLPGVAGIILTIGMAVDANILIYERIREESEKGRKLFQAAKNGFQHALSAIVDANVTTFLTAAILYKIGTGPIRGFATTLMIGIITSLFSALVITRVFVHLSLEKGVERFNMSRIIGKTNFAFMEKAKVALTCSMILIVGGVALFAAVPAKDKLSIDFLGGFQLTARMDEPQPVQKIRDLIGEIDGTIGDAEVKALLASGSSEEGYREFRITYKADRVEVAADETSTEKTGEALIRQALASVLQHDPVEIAPGEGDRIDGRIYFEEDHPAEEIAGVLGEVSLAEVTVAPIAGRQGAYTFSARPPAGIDAETLVTPISKAFSGRKDSSQRSYVLAQPIPEASIVGAQVVGELRDAAIIAILVSLFVIVMYIRVRFAEYAYGLAAVAALVHDVLITLGALAVAIDFQLVEAEISLPMIAAFLTIIGYSLNDTIIVFDRIRENRPRMKGSLRETLNVSINQTLSRTLLTSMTTMVVVIILLVFNYGSGSVLEGFAFALLVGILVGTYSSIFVASPILLWIEGRGERLRSKAGKKAEAVA